VRATNLATNDCNQAPAVGRPPVHMLIDFMAFMFGQVYHYVTMGVVQKPAFSLSWVGA
jgi:hypothetical protein